MLHVVLLSILLTFETVQAVFQLLEGQNPLPMSYRIQPHCSGGNAFVRLSSPRDNYIMMFEYFKFNDESGSFEMHSSFHVGGSFTSYDLWDIYPCGLEDNMILLTPFVVHLINHPDVYDFYLDTAVYEYDEDMEEWANTTLLENSRLSGCSLLDDTVMLRGLSPCIQSRSNEDLWEVEDCFPRFGSSVLMGTKNLAFIMARDDDGDSDLGTIENQGSISVARRNPGSSNWTLSERFFWPIPHDLDIGSDRPIRMRDLAYSDNVLAVSAYVFYTSGPEVVLFLWEVQVDGSLAPLEAISVGLFEGVDALFRYSIFLQGKLLVVSHSLTLESSIYKKTLGPNGTTFALDSTIPCKAEAVTADWYIVASCSDATYIYHQAPTPMPSVLSSDVPSTFPTEMPTNLPSTVPTVASSTVPTTDPTVDTSTLPTSVSSAVPTTTSSTVPTAVPTIDTCPCDRFQMICRLHHGCVLPLEVFTADHDP